MARASRNKPDKMLGRTLNDTYKLEQRIGFGGMGRVYAGQHLRLSRPVAVKVLMSKFSSNPDAVERFRHEARSASALGHPNIVQVFDFNQSEDHNWYIVMELLEGEDLRAKLKREKRLPPMDCLPIFQQVCDALDLAHSKGLVHRDLKPSNIYLRMLPARTEVKILDFGVAKVLGADLGLTMDGTMLGTPHYMAPEQAAGEGNLTARVDIYAIGTVLFEMLTGRRPFEGDSPLTVLHLRATRPPPAPSSIVPALPQAVDDVIVRALSREPADRFESPAQMALAFEKAIADAPSDRSTYTLIETETPVDSDTDPLSDGPDTIMGVHSGDADITGETMLASMDSSVSSSFSASSSSVIQLKSSDELRMATILVVTVSPLDPDESDPDEMLEITEALLEKLAEEVRELGGTIEKDIGDAMTAVFGVPTATGDDPVHAVRAGLAARKIGRRHLNKGVETRVGVQTGRILKRSGRTGVTGEVVKVANKLADECPAGDVLVGHQTFVHIRGRFDVSFRDELRVRGQKQPLRTYRVTGERDHGVVLEGRGDGQREAPLVGREAERDYLRGLYYRAARESQAQVVQILGGRGMGSTRLVHELASTLEEQSERFSYFPASASELAAPTPYGLLSEIVRVKTGTSRGVRGREAEAKLMDLISWPFSTSGSMTTVAEKPAVTPWEIVHSLGAAIGVQFEDDDTGTGAGAIETSPEKLAVAIATYLRALTRHQPVVIALDDLHQSDEETLELLELMMHQLEDTPVMLIAIARPEFAETRSGKMSGLEHFTTIELHSLSAAAVTALVNSLLDGQAPSGLGPAIHARSGGNPHLVEEMVAHLRDNGNICREDESGPWVVLGDLADLDVPSRAEALLQARLDQLPRQDRELLRCAAVIGSNFWEAALRSLGLDRVEARLDALSQSDLVRLRPTSRFSNTRQWAFKSELMAEVARGNLPSRDRRQLNEAVADWLGTQDQRDPDTLSLRAHHLVLAGQRAAALDLMAEAGRLAERKQRWEVALASYIRAQELAAAEGDEASSIYHATHVGRLGVRAHAPSKAVPVLEHAAQQAEEAGDESMQANLLQLLGRNFAIQGEKAKAREVTERAHDIAQRRGDLRLRFETAKALGFVNYYGYDFADAAKAFEQCIEMAEELKDQDEVAMNIYNVADSSLSAGDLDRALEFADKAVEACSGREKVSFLRRSASGISAHVRAFLHNDERGFDELEQWMHYADENGYVEQQLDARYYLATSLEQQGRHDEALAVARSGIDLAEKSEGEQSRTKMIELVQQLEGRARVATVPPPPDAT